MKKNTAENKCFFWTSLCLTLVSNAIAFQSSRLFTKNCHHFSLILPIDAGIPFLPWTISIYFGCFLFWFAIYHRISRLPREQANRFFCANHLGKAVCFVIFLLFPTVISRPDVNGTAVWDIFMQFLYRIDAPDNLFPSIHCLIAWLCWVGVRGNREVPVLWRICALIMAILVCLSTLTTRQHEILDVFGGILLSELSYRLSGLPALRDLYARLIVRLIHRILTIGNKVLS